MARFLVVPVALTMPLLAGVFRRREATFAISLLAVVTLALAHSQNTQKPIGSSRVVRVWNALNPYTAHLTQARPWNLTQAQAVSPTWQHAVAFDLEKLDASVPANAHLGVVFGSDDPSYLLFDYVVLGNSRDTRLTGELTTAGWTDRQLGLAGRPPSWTLVVSHAKPRIEVTNHVTATRPLERANSGISGR